MVFLDKPHIKQFTDIFDTSIKNIFIFKIYIYYYILSIYNIGIHYLTFKNILFDNIFCNSYFLFLNIFFCALSFFIVLQNYHIYPINKISNTAFSFFCSNTIISILTRIYVHSFIISMEIITNSILLSIVIYTIKYKTDNFLINKLNYILFPSYLCSLLFIQYNNLVTNHQFIYLIIYSVILLIIHMQNIKIIIKRYMQNDFYLAYLNIYFILIDIIDIIFVDIIIEIFFPKTKYNK